MIKRRFSYAKKSVFCTVTTTVVDLFRFFKSSGCSGALAEGYADSVGFLRLTEEFGYGVRHMKAGVDMDNYYPRLKDLREDHDLSQQAIADYLGMKQPQYSRYERGLRDIPTDVLIRLALFYKTSTDYILGLTDHSRPYRK